MDVLTQVISAYRASGKLFEAHCDLLYPCDLDCEHCYLDDKARPQRSTQFWKGVFDQLADQQVMLLHLSGGEVFLRKDLFELIEHARGRGLMVCLKTHGGLVTADHARRLADLGVSIVYVSYYSDRPEVHDAITRRQGSHEKTLAGLRHLAKAGLRVKVNLTVMERNVDDVSQVVRQCEELGIQVGISTEIHSAQSGDGIPLEVALPLDERADFHTRIDVRSSACAVDGASNDWGEKAICGAAHTSVYIDPEGTVMPCSFWPAPLGVLEEGTRLSDLLEASREFQEMRSYTNADRHSCGSCAGKDICHFCPGESWHQTRDPMAPATAICSDTYSQVVAKARLAGEPEPAKPPGLRRSPFRVLNAGQHACGG